jgi:hypothetical protein
VLGYEDGVIEAPKPARIQRICARRAASGDLDLLHLPG